MSRPQQYTDDLRLAHILADSVDRVSAMRFRDRPVFSPTSESAEPLRRHPPRHRWRRGSRLLSSPQNRRYRSRSLPITPRVWLRRLRSFSALSCRVCVLVTVLPVSMPL